MPRKIVVAHIKRDDLKTVGSAVEQELNSPTYYGKAWYNNKEFWIQGKAQIEAFVQSMLSLIEECEKIFKDEESLQGFKADREFLNNLLNIKAS